MQVRPPLAPWIVADGPPLPPDWQELPAELAEGADPARAEGRVRPELVAVAARPLTALAQAALQPPASRLALALAELAVTGHRSYTELSKADPSDDPAALVRRVIAMAEAAAPTADRAGIAARALALVDRARQTSRWLRGRTAHDRKAAYAAMHPNLPFDQRPWVAVCGEIDPPDRPVNMPATQLDQEDVLVPVPSRATPIRVRAAHSDAVVDATSTAKIVFFLHGLGSRLEETSAVAASLVAKGYGVLALDLPNQGYSERFAFADVGLTDMPNTGTRDAAGKLRVYAMDFYVDFVVRFLRTFDAQHPAGRVLARLASVGGGSEGGCLSLRLAMAAPSVVRRATPWSPGAIWESFLDNDFIHHLVLRDGPIHDVTSEENPLSRASYVAGNFDVPLGGGIGAFVGMPRPADTWWRNGWAGKELGAPHGFQVTFPSTGHSLHDERPEQLAQEIAGFLGEAGRAP